MGCILRIVNVHFLYLDLEQYDKDYIDCDFVKRVPMDMLDSIRLSSTCSSALRGMLNFWWPNRLSASEASLVLRGVTMAELQQQVMVTNEYSTTSGGYLSVDQGDILTVVFVGRSGSDEDGWMYCWHGLREGWLPLSCATVFEADTHMAGEKVDEMCDDNGIEFDTTLDCREGGCCVDARHALVDAGDSIGVWQNKCFQAAVLRVCPHSVRAAMERFFLLACANHDGSGLFGSPVAAGNFLAVCHALESYGGHVLVYAAGSVDEWLSGCISSLSSLGMRAGRIRGALFWVLDEMHV